MRLISNLGAEVASAKRGKRGNEDTFGMDDEDWNVYRAIVSLCTPVAMVSLNSSHFRTSMLKIVIVRRKRVNC